jgi:hypothetical protein
MLIAMIIAQQKGGTIVREVDSAAVTICGVPSTYGLDVKTIECTNLNKKRGEDALHAQRKRIDCILDKGSELVKKCDSNRFWKYQSVDEEERSFFKDELKWLLYSVNPQVADRYWKDYRSIEKRITKGHLGNYWVREQEWVVVNPGDQAE